MIKLFTPVLLLMLLMVGGCKKNPNKTDLPYGFGWNGTDDPTKVPQSINSINFAAGATYPASASIVSKFPPIGNQGQYGTCVAWAVGYGVKTAIHGMDKGFNATQLASSANQFSPKDLFTALPDSKKGADCNGADFTDALDIILNRGIATMQTVPYTGLGSCTQSTLQSSWTTEANNYKIKNYRRINLTVNEIKSYISTNVPIVCGAKLADNFMQWNSDDVLSSNTSFDQVGQHAYHALAIAGYDDAKGPNGAFEIINSWGENWGNAGRIWVDYNFFINTFCFGGNVFIATNSDGGPTPPAPDPVSNGYVDLAPWAFTDVNTYNLSYPTERYIEFNVYNIGDQTASSSTGWALYYLYYNAYNSDDYGFLIVDAADNSISPGTQYTDGNGVVHFNANIGAGDDLANTMFSSSFISQYYYVPNNVSGYYYLVLIADPLNVITENDETNNLFYTTNQYPITFMNGVGKREMPAKPISEFRLKNSMQPVAANLRIHPFVTAVNQTNPNAYSPDEIKDMIKIEKKTGRWQSKLNSFISMHPQNALTSKMKSKPISDNK
ncbi:MAG: C1 family peptidase [Bacteroidetes bacterium]|nr:C1 family peptidase [Bacteroidota bacterium]